MLKITSASTHHPLHHRRRKINLPFGTQRLLAALEGIEGGFAIGASIVVALSFTGIDRQLLLTTALVSIIVSGFNTASVKYSSEHYLDELDGREKKNPLKHYFLPSLIEFVCYFAISIVSILPLLFVDDTVQAVNATVAVTLGLLFIAGFWRGFILRMDKVRDGLETLILGIGIIAVGAISGIVLHLH